MALTKQPRRTVVVADPLWSQFVEMAERRGVSVSELTRMAMTELLDRAVTQQVPHGRYATAHTAPAATPRELAAPAKVLFDPPEYPGGFKDLGPGRGGRLYANNTEFTFPEERRGDWHRVAWLVKKIAGSTGDGWGPTMEDLTPIELAWLNPIPA